MRASLLVRLACSAIVALAVASPSANVFAACFQVDGTQIPELKSALGDAKAVLGDDPSQRIGPLKIVYQRIAEAAGIRPALLLCNDPILNAYALGDGGNGFIVFFAPVLEIINNNADELAFLLAHEFSHLLLNHRSQKHTAFRNLAKWAQWIAKDRYQRSGRAVEARKQATDFWNVESKRFSRALEREADDKGFSLAVTVAKFSVDGGKRFFAKMAKLPQSDGPTYLSSHHSDIERFERADLQSLNQSYIDAAQDLLDQRKWLGLRNLVDRWLRVTPQSGAGWYYNGRSLIHRVKSKEDITQAFESSVSYYLGSKSLGERSQEDQQEVASAWFYLCVALFDEEYKFESANCSRRITDSDTKDEFQRQTFQWALIVGGSEMLYPKDFWIAREESGSKLMTNDKSIAASRGPLHDFPPLWKAVRFPAINGQ